MNKRKAAIIDKHDEKLLHELSHNPKRPLRELATRLNLSFVTIMNRIKKLEREKIITGYTTRINYEKLGYGIHVVIHIRIAKGKLFELEKKIARHPNIYAVYDTTGDFDCTLIGRFKTTNAMDNFLKKIQAYDFVERTNTKLVLNTIKEQPMELR